MTQIGVLGLGATGAHCVRQMRDLAEIEVLASDRNQQRQTEIVEAVGSNVRPSSADLAGSSVVVLATPAGSHVQEAARFISRGTGVVSLSDNPEDVVGLLGLHDLALAQRQSLIVGAGFVPGLSCLLARFAGDSLDRVEEIAIWKAGTAGPSCARQHHHSLKSDGRDWIDQQWVTRRGGSGRDLAWFPGSIGARDCYRGALPSPLLLQRRYPKANRISARVSATRRDRLTSRLPMLRPPHRDGGPGAMRVEVRGMLDGAYETRIYGVMDHPSVAAGSVAALAALGIGRGEFAPGAFGLSEIDDVAGFLRELHHRGVKAATFGGTRNLSLDVTPDQP